MMRVRLLGAVSVEVDGRPVEVPSGRPGEVLAWLAANPGLHRRISVASVFWPDVTDSTARASLRTALWTLRRALGEDGARFLIVDRQSVGLDGPDLWVDLRQRDSWSVDQVMAADLDLLPWIEGEWVDELRDQHRAAVVRLLGAVDDAAEASGDTDTCVRVARRLTEIDPFSEEYHRLLLRRLVAVGERGAATLEHQRFRRRLRDELGVAPSSTTLEVAERVLAGQRATPRSDEVPRRLVRLQPELMVGRDRENQRLFDEWSATRREGDVRVVVVEGEAGIGKTRLLAEFASRVRGDGGRVLFGAAAEDALLPAEPFLEALARRQVLDGEDILEVVRQGLATATLERPVALLLDDFQWADSVSFSVLRRLVRFPAGRGLAIVLARRVEGDPDPKLTSLVADVARDAPVSRIELDPLSLEATAALLQDLDPDGRLVDRAANVHRDAEGNPLFVRELGRYLVETPAEPIGADPVPDTIRDLVAIRLDRLSPLAAEAVSVAAVLGTRVPTAVLQGMLSGEDVLGPVEEAVAMGLMEEEGVGIHAFRHALVRTAVYDLVSRSRRAELHRRAADALRAVHGEGDGPHLCDIAEHRCAAVPLDSPGAAAADARRAGRWAIDHLAHDRAVVMLTKALQVCEPSARQDLAVLRAVAFQRLTHDVIDAASV